jgi:hypothetical protein
MQYFDRTGNQVSALEALDPLTKSLRDGFRQRVSMTDAAQVRFADGASILSDGIPAAYHKPGYRQSALHVDRTAINDAHAQYEAELTNRWRDSASPELTDPSGLASSDPDEDDEDDEDDEKGNPPTGQGAAGQHGRQPELNNSETDPKKIRRYHQRREREAGRRPWTDAARLKDAAYREHLDYLTTSWKRGK